MGEAFICARFTAWKIAESFRADIIILATGYRASLPAYLKPLPRVSSRCGTASAATAEF
ncbi:hypothetical protein M8494_32575 [Serratia ureilytica]